MIDIELIRAAFTNIVAQAIEALPRLITGIIILLIGWVISRLLRALIQKAAEQIGLDQILDRVGLGPQIDKAGIERSPAEILGLFIFWLVFLNFLLVGLEGVGLSAAVEPLKNVIAFLPRFLAALVTLVAGALLAQFLGRATQAAVSTSGIDFDRQVGQGVTGLVLVVVTIIVLGQLGIDTSIMINLVTIVIALSIAGLALAFGLGGRHAARNVLAGFYARDQFNLGDRISLDGEEGTLEGIGTMNAEVQLTGERLIIPNTRLTEEAVKIII